MHNLGRHYTRGLGLPLDHEKAFALNQRGAALDHDTSIQRVGESYSAGYGVKQDDAQAFLWFQRAAEMGCPEAHMSVAASYVEGKGVAKDPKAGISHDVQAAEAGQNDMLVVDPTFLHLLSDADVVTRIHAARARHGCSLDSISQVHTGLGEFEFNFCFTSEPDGLNLRFKALVNLDASDNIVSVEVDDLRVFQ